MARIKKLNQVFTVDWREALLQFLFWKKAQKISEQTYRDYDSQVKLFFKRHPNSFDSILDLETNLYEYLGQDGIRPSTYNNRLVYLRTFLNWCLYKKIIELNPLKSIKKRKAEGRIVNISLDILKRLLQLPDKKTFTGLRDFGLILLTLDTGIRPKEALSLTIRDFNSTANEIYILADNAKTRVSRTIQYQMQPQGQYVILFLVERLLDKARTAKLSSFDLGEFEKQMSEIIAEKNAEKPIDQFHEGDTILYDGQNEDNISLRRRYLS